MSKPRYRWWGYARNVVRAYPKLMAAKCLAEDDLSDRDAVTQAINITKQKRKGGDMLGLIKGVYWGRSEQSIEKAASHLYISGTTAIRWHGEFVRTVGKCLGFAVSDEGKKKGKTMHKAIEIPNRFGKQAD